MKNCTASTHVETGHRSARCTGFEVVLKAEGEQVPNSMFGAPSW